MMAWSRAFPSSAQSGTVSCIMRHDVRRVVTKYGMETLRGMTIAEGLNMNSEARPGFRESLHDRAKRARLI
jgi:acyl-CoA hydrolase